MKHPTTDFGSFVSPTRRQMLVGVAATALVGACSDNGFDGPPMPTPTPSPTPSPTHSPAAFMGAVYAGSNKLGGNTVVAFGRNSDGTLSPIDEYASGGNGGVFDGTNDGLDPLISEDAIVAIDDRFLLVVNAGSDSISSFAINADFSLTLVDTAGTRGVGPNSIAHNAGLVYVANVDSDGTPADPAAQRGNVTGFRFDSDTGRLRPIAGSKRELSNRPSNIEFSPDGEYLVVSSWNAGSILLPGSDGNDELVVYGVQANGTLTPSPVSRAASTLPGNAAGRNLPAAIGFEIVKRSGRTCVIVSEAREFLSTGEPGMLPMFQTASVSTWALRSDGSLVARSQDVLTGPTLTTRPAAPTSACWIVVSPDGTLFWVAHASGAVISSFSLNSDCTASLIDGRAAEGAPADSNAADPLANADGFVDIAVSNDGRYLYQLLGLKGTINVYTIGSNGSLSSPQAATGLLPLTNIAGLVSVEPRGT